MNRRPEWLVPLCVWMLLPLLVALAAAIFTR
jgi:hypothetical protein